MKSDLIIINLNARTKEEVIEDLVQRLFDSGYISDRQSFKEAILARENQCSTGIGKGVAIPHAKTSSLHEPVIVFGRSVQGIDYDALDGQPTHLFFMIAAPEGVKNQHLEVISSLTSYLRDSSFRESLKKAKTVEDILETIEKKDKGKMKDIQEARSPNSKKIVAVTACPTGIAHTYMAADALVEKAKEMGITVKVETQGSVGIKNLLTAHEIKEATAVIVAADIQVEMERFQGKHVIQAPVSEGIRRPEALIQKALNQEGPIYQEKVLDKDSTNPIDKRENNHMNPLKRGIKNGYQHIMNGMSNMLPFVVSGGILMAISTTIVTNAGGLDHPFLQSLIKAFIYIGDGHALLFILPVLAGFIAVSIADRPGFAPGMVGGLIAANGETGFLGGIIAGFLAGFIIRALRKVFLHVPTALNGLKPVLLYPLFGVLITGMMMVYVVIDPLRGLHHLILQFFSEMGTVNLVLLGCVLGGMMAIDMGGPINKIAFTFGIAMLDSDAFTPQAAVMAGGMVPPLGIALATTLFKKKFTQQEREAGRANYMMGLSFITEGAIPFAMKDPKRIIPSIVIGSSLAGALSCVFRIGLQTPHGGIFVFPFVYGNPFLYLLAVSVGVFSTALMVGFLKEDVNSIQEKV